MEWNVDNDQIYTSEFFFSLQLLQLLAHAYSYISYRLNPPKPPFAAARNHAQSRGGAPKKILHTPEFHK